MPGRRASPASPAAKTLSPCLPGCGDHCLPVRGAGGLIGGQTGQTISDIGQTVGGFLPFSTVPSGTGPQGQPGQPGGEDLIAVPAGLWGSLISLVSKGAGGLIGGQTGQTISDIGQTVGGFLPFSTVPSGARPQGQPGQPGGEDLIAVPAGLWGSLVSLVSKGAGGLIGGQSRPDHQRHRADRRRLPALLDSPERYRAAGPARPARRRRPYRRPCRAVGITDLPGQ